MNDHNIGSHYASDNTVLARYYHGPVIDELLCRVTETNTVYYHHDGLGSTVALTDSTGNVVESYTYDVYGQPSILSATYHLLPTSSVTNRFLFTGREYLADLALYDYRHRFYSPSLGRFLQTDPIRFDAEDVNLYRYVGNNVVCKIDPNGNMAQLIAAAWVLNLMKNAAVGATVGFTTGLLKVGIDYALNPTPKRGKDQFATVAASTSAGYIGGVISSIPYAGPTIGGSVSGVSGVALEDAWSNKKLSPQSLNRRLEYAGKFGAFAGLVSTPEISGTLSSAVIPIATFISDIITSYLMETVETIEENPRKTECYE